MFWSSFSLSSGPHSPLHFSQNTGHRAVLSSPHLYITEESWRQGPLPPAGMPCQRDLAQIWIPPLSLSIPFFLAAILLSGDWAFLTGWLGKQLKAMTFFPWPLTLGQWLGGRVTGVAASHFSLHQEYICSDLHHSGRSPPHHPSRVWLAYEEPFLGSGLSLLLSFIFPGSGDWT
jgi:hypothetical protein